MNEINWRKWWTSYALSTGGTPPRVRGSVAADVGPAAFDAVELLTAKRTRGEDPLRVERPGGDHLTILDLGSGPGVLALKIRDSLSGVLGRPVITIVSDIAPGFLEAGPKGVPAVALDATALPFVAETFDAVVAYSSLQYFTAPQLLSRAFEEIFRVLAPGRPVIVCAYPDQAHQSRIVKGYDSIDMAPEIKVERRRITAGQLWLSRANVAEMAKKAGFVETNVHDMNPALWESSYMFNLRGIKPPKGA